MKANRNSKTTKALLVLYRLGYRVDDAGQIFNGQGRMIRGSVKAPDGYVQISVRMGEHHVNVFAHRLMALQKYGEAIFAAGIEVRHKDGNPRNNSRNNILIGSARENSMDKKPEVRRRAALVASHSFHDQSRWSVIDADRLEGLSYKQLRSKYGVALGTLSYRYSTKTKAQHDQSSN